MATPPSAISQQRRIHRESDILQRGARNKFITAIAGTKERVPLRRISEAIEIGDLATAESVIDLEATDAEFGGVSEVLFDGVRRGKDLAIGDTPIAEGTVVQFDLFSLRVVEFIRMDTARLVTGVSEQTKKSIRQSILTAFNEGLNPRVAARMIRDEIGLTPKQQGAITKFRNNLIDQGLPRERIERMLKRRRDKALRQRSESIARTETLRALSDGRQQFWNQAVEQGALDETELERQWLTAQDERVDCKICKPLNRDRVGMFEDFVADTGQTFTNPPAHPQCRCTVVLVRKTGALRLRRAA